MILFKIKCVTCQSGLAVHDEALIGQIVACPKCSSMVEIIAPASTEQPAEELGNESQTPSGLVQHDSPQTELAESVAPAAPSNLLMIGGALASVLVGAALVGLAMFSGSDVPNVTDARSDLETAQASLNSDEVIPAVEKEFINEKQHEIVQEPAIEEVVLEQSQSAISDTTSQEELSANTDLELAEIETEAVVDVPSEKVKEPVRVARRFDSLYLDPDNLDLNTLDEVAADAESHQPSTAELISQGVAPAAAPEKQPMVPVVRRNPEDPTALGNRDAKVALQQKIPVLEFKEIPLTYFLRLVSQLSGVPVSASPEQLLMAGISLRKPVSLSGKEIRLSEAMRQVLEPLKLEYMAENGQIIVLRKDAAKQREINYPIDDLIGSSKDEQKISAWLVELIKPKSWQQNGGSGAIELSSGALRVNQSQRVHYQLLVFLERWRLMRDLPLKSRFPVKRLVETSPWLAIASQLTAPTTFTFSDYTPIEQIIAHWESELGIPISVDWPALAEVQLWPQSGISCAITNHEWQTALDQVLEPLGLGWRAVPGKSLEITTLNNIEAELQLDLFALPKNHSVILDNIKQLAEASISQGSVFIRDAEHNILFTLQPATVQRRIANQLGPNP